MLICADGLCRVTADGPSAKPLLTQGLGELCRQYVAVFGGNTTRAESVKRLELRNQRIEHIKSK